MNVTEYKSNKKIIGSIIKLNRTTKNISQKSLSKGICVPSYLSRIENGDLLPSEDVISIIFNRLGLQFNDSEDFISNGNALFKEFFERLNSNEFDYTNAIFEKIESMENEYIASPLIIDYFLAKLARYCATPEREKFEKSQTILLSSFELLSPKQKFIYKFYLGVDTLICSQDKPKGKKYIEEALNYKETGHCYFWLSFAYITENNPIKAYHAIKKALDFYISEGNILSIMDSYEKFAEVHFMLDNYNDSIQYLEIALNMAKKMNNKYFVEHLNSIMAWVYYRLKEYDKSLAYIKQNRGLVDHRMVIPDSIIESLVHFTLQDKKSLKSSIKKLKNNATLEHIDKTMASKLYKFFTLFIENDDYLKNPELEDLLLYIVKHIHKLVELKKVFTTLLKDYYIHNRRYKDALMLLNNIENQSTYKSII